MAGGAGGDVHGQTAANLPSVWLGGIGMQGRSGAQASAVLCVQVRDAAHFPNATACHLAAAHLPPHPAG